MVPSSRDLTLRLTQHPGRDLATASSTQDFIHEPIAWEFLVYGWLMHPGLHQGPDVCLCSAQHLGYDTRMGETSGASAVKHVARKPRGMLQRQQHKAASLPRLVSATTSYCGSATCKTDIPSFKAFCMQYSRTKSRTNTAAAQWGQHDSLQ